MQHDEKIIQLLTEIRDGQQKQVALYENTLARQQALVKMQKKGVILSLTVSMTIIVVILLWTGVI